ncbi:MAG: glutaminyl-peptide cyclotransferase [Anaerolineaceae bacterium]|nr:glutaminyl-peptide cyclotransferase [Anaerolineaceae bacterium]
MRFLLGVSLLFGFCALAGCQKNNAIPDDLGPEAHVEVLGQALPHDETAFTQGLLVHEGYFFESTGLVGHSTLRKTEIQSGKVLAQKELDPSLFGEGLALLNGKLYQLTWKNRIGLIYDAKTLEQLGTFPISGEGWGLTTDGNELILSDGSDQLTWLDGKNLKPTKTLQVKMNGQAVHKINELEKINGYIYANVFQTDIILRIDPKSGEVLTVIDASELRPASTKADPNSVLNGIAWDEKNQKLYLTGKKWPLVYQVRLVNGPRPTPTTQP